MAQNMIPDPSVMGENRTCPGCKNSVVTENGGVVVAFGCVLLILPVQWPSNYDTNRGCYLYTVNHTSTLIASNAQNATSR